jgi:hypothetical protein
MCSQLRRGRSGTYRSTWLELHLTNEIGEPAEAWKDWPGHIKSRSWNVCAFYSLDGFTIQFNSGAVWVLVDPRPVPGWKQW